MYTGSARTPHERASVTAHLATDAGTLPKARPDAGECVKTFSAEGTLSVGGAPGACQTTGQRVGPTSRLAASAILRRAGVSLASVMPCRVGGGAGRLANAATRPPRLQPVPTSRQTCARLPESRAGGMLWTSDAAPRRPAGCRQPSHTMGWSASCGSRHPTAPPSTLAASRATPAMSADTVQAGSGEWMSRIRDGGSIMCSSRALPCSCLGRCVEVACTMACFPAQRSACTAATTLFECRPPTTCHSWCCDQAAERATSASFRCLLPPSRPPTKSSLIKASGVPAEPPAQPAPKF